MFFASNRPIPAHSSHFCLVFALPGDTKPLATEVDSCKKGAPIPVCDGKVRKESDFQRSSRAKCARYGNPVVEAGKVTTATPRG